MLFSKHWLWGEKRLHLNEIINIVRAKLPLKLAICLKKTHKNEKKTHFFYRSLDKKKGVEIRVLKIENVFLC